MRPALIPILALLALTTVAPAQDLPESETPAAMATGDDTGDLPGGATTRDGGDDETGVEPADDAFFTLDATEVSLDDFKWTNRLVLVFSDSPANPQFIQQLDELEEGWAQLRDRDVVVITDADPDAQSEARTRIRPRGFSLVWIDKDGEVRLRKPLPWSTREIVRSIDKTDLRRQEMLEQNPGR